MERDSNEPEDQRPVEDLPVEALLSLCQRRRTIGLEIMRGWDVSTKQNLHIVKRVVDSIFREVEKFLEGSLRRYEKVTSYFNKLRMKLEEGENLRECAGSFEIMKRESVAGVESVGAEKAFAEAIDLFGREQELYVARVREFHKRVQEEVVVKELTEGTRNLENNIKAIVQKMTLLREKIKKNSDVAAEKISKFGETSFESLSSSSGSRARRPKTNTLDFAISFVMNLQELSQLIREEWELSRSFFEHSFVLENRRLETLRRAFLKYISLLGESFGRETETSFTRSALAFESIFSEDVSRSCISLESMLAQGEKEIIKAYTGSDGVTLDSLSRFVSNCNTEGIDNVIEQFVLRKFFGYIGEGTFQSPIRILFSTDLFLSIYKEREEGLELLLSSPVETIELKIKIDRGVVEFNFKEKGFLWDTKKKLQTILTISDLDDLAGFHKKLCRQVSQAEAARKAQSKSSGSSEASSKKDILQTPNSEKETDSPISEVQSPPFQETSSEVAPSEVPKSENLIHSEKAIVDLAESFKKQKPVIDSQAEKKEELVSDGSEEKKDEEVEVKGSDENQD